jgi:6-phosphogluconate dehydrogenase
MNLGLVGLGAMGRNLAWNLHARGFPFAVCSYQAAEVERFRAGLAASPPAFSSVRELVVVLDRPRTVFLMVTAGAPVDAVLGDLAPLLEPGDCVIDGGNSHFADTRRRSAALAERGIGFLGVGVSGGEAGARHGASIMVGGARADYDHNRDVFRALAARSGDASCETWIGPDGAGHFTKMVHNGIEYALMQSIAEIWRFMDQGLRLPGEAQRRAFESWSQGPAASYLVDITAEILGVEDVPGTQLVDVVSDRAAQKGTGRWTVEAAFELGIAVPTIIAAVSERLLSARKDRGSSAGRPIDANEAHWLPALERALYASYLAIFDQGFRLLAAASEVYEWRLDLAAIARVWQGGCIIRADVLRDIATAIEPGTLLAAPAIQARVSEAERDWRRVVGACVQAGMTAPALASALAYYDSLAAARMPTRLVQAQRDYFGAHGFERTDKPGRFHGPWHKP